MEELISLLLTSRLLSPVSLQEQCVSLSLSLETFVARGNNPSLTLFLAVSVTTL